MTINQSPFTFISNMLVMTLATGILTFDYFYHIDYRFHFMKQDCI